MCSHVYEWRHIVFHARDGAGGKFVVRAEFMQLAVIIAFSRFIQPAHLRAGDLRSSAVQKDIFPFPRCWACGVLATRCCTPGCRDRGMSRKTRVKLVRLGQHCLQASTAKRKLGARGICRGLHRT